MGIFRAYVDKAEGNEHVRVIDFVAADMAEAERKAARAVKKSEVVGQVVEVAPDASLVLEEI